MNTVLAFTFGGVILLLIGRSLVTVYKTGQTEMSAHDRRVALAIVAAILVAFVGVVFVLQFARQ